MSEEGKLSRREFTLSVPSALAMLNGAAIMISSCGDSAPSTTLTTPTTPSPTAPSPSSGQPAGASAFVSANHGHRATITSAELSAGNSLTLDISGDADHPHTVELSDDDVLAIAAGQRVTRAASLLEDDPLYPSVDTHGHTVTFN